MTTEINRIINTLKHTFEKNAWHGPAVLEVLEGITDEHAHQKIGDSHSIIQLVTHMTAWRNYVIEKLNGNDAFELTDEQNFPDEKNWNQAVANLIASQQKLITALSTTSVEKLNEKVPGREFKFYVMLHGIIHHDVYHIGQIQLIKKFT
jgi:uncharacterized damage-inducible protein DinB